MTRNKSAEKPDGQGPSVWPTSPSVVREGNEHQDIPLYSPPWLSGGRISHATIPQLSLKVLNQVDLNEHICQDMCCIGGPRVSHSRPLTTQDGYLSAICCCGDRSSSRHTQQPLFVSSSRARR